MPSKSNAKALWENGYGVIKHSAETKKRIHSLIETLRRKRAIAKGVSPYALLAAADRITSAGLWLVVHQAYAKQFFIDGRPLSQEHFKADPQGHVGGALNMVPAYVGYMVANAISGFTRSWVMEQGHAVAAIDAVNLLLSNMGKAHAARYDYSDKGLSRYARDFYSYALNKKGEQDSPLGSHVNVHTAGGFLEGGYLGFASLQYAHMPLPGERLVAFLSDGAFEEQRGSDWTHRWWRAEDSGLIAPIMIANGRRIDQRSSLLQEGGAKWFAEHLRVNNFDPFIFDGRDPAAFAWSIIEQEYKLQEYTSQINNINHYDIRIPYGIAVAPKGAGFYNEGTNYAHNLPLVQNPSKDGTAIARFNLHAGKLWVEEKELKAAAKALQNHKTVKRKKEKDHPLAQRHVAIKKLPRLKIKPIPHNRKEARAWTQASPMDAIDAGFIMTVKSNPHLRPRVGNPDEMLSNKMDHTLAELAFRVTAAEQGIEESTLGKVITALNEEAVAAAAFGNKGGINIIVTYEAFGAKMFGEARQEVIFAKHQKDVGRPARWLSVPLVLTSNTWENSKNELSHQDPSMAESMLSETADISRVFFPADYNTASALMQHIYQTHGQVWTIVAPKRNAPVLFSEAEATALVEKGGIPVSFAGYEPKKATIALLAVGSYHLWEVLQASERLTAEKIPHSVGYIAEPGRFRISRNKGEKEHLASPALVKSLVPEKAKHVLLATHTRPEVLVGALQPLWQGRNVRGLGFINAGGTLDVDGMLFVNKCSFAHILYDIAEMLGLRPSRLLSKKELAAITSKRSPDGVVTGK